MKKYLQNTRFTCLPDCVNCCKLTGGYVYFNDAEAEAMAGHLEMDLAAFRKWFTRLVDNRSCLVDGDGENCIFLEEDKCLIYPVRPTQCRTYPFWPENLKSKETWALTRRDCPGLGKGEIVPVKEIIRICRGKSLDSNR